MPEFSDVAVSERKDMPAWGNRKREKEEERGRGEGGRERVSE